MICGWCCHIRTGGAQKAALIAARFRCSVCAVGHAHPGHPRPFLPDGIPWLELGLTHRPWWARWCFILAQLDKLIRWLFRCRRWFASWFQARVRQGGRGPATQLFRSERRRRPAVFAICAGSSAVSGPIGSCPCSPAPTSPVVVLPGTCRFTWWCRSATTPRVSCCQRCGNVCPGIGGRRW